MYPYNKIVSTGNTRKSPRFQSKKPSLQTAASNDLIGTTVGHSEINSGLANQGMMTLKSISTHDSISQLTDTQMSTETVGHNEKKLSQTKEQKSKNEEKEDSEDSEDSYHSDQCP